ncbi:MAG: sigma-70 family RNA polymerase sigma factor [Bacillota bacterium]|nr:sigma-70 family RNA polymerase sigma factor [Bacillota bacterium]
MPRRGGLGGLTLEEGCERALVERARRGDVAAFEELIRPELARIYGAAARLVGRQEAEDLVQEAVLRAFRSLDGFRGGARFATWLYRIVVNLCVDHGRRRSRREWREEPLEATERAAEGAAGAGHDPEAALLAAERQQLVQAALAELPADYRVVILLRDVEGLTYEEVAELTGLPLGTVKSRVFRGRRALRERLAEAGLLPSVQRGRGVAE